jgi:hypothetical protein
MHVPLPGVECNSLVIPLHEPISTYRLNALGRRSRGPVNEKAGERTQGNSGPEGSRRPAGTAERRNRGQRNHEKTRKATEYRQGKQERNRIPDESGPSKRDLCI